MLRVIYAVIYAERHVCWVSLMLSVIYAVINAECHFSECREKAHYADS
jgi:hypothetical protein